MKRKIPKIKVVAVRELRLNSTLQAVHQKIIEHLGLDEKYKRYILDFTIGRRMAKGEILAVDELEAWHIASTETVSRWKLNMGMNRYDRRK